MTKGTSNQGGEPVAPIPNWQPEMVPVPPADAGHVSIDKTGPFEAGSYQTFTLTYHAGRYGIDDTGSLKICWRFASDQARPQFDKKGEPNYVSVVASNGAVLDVRFDPKQNTRPWDRALYIKVAQGFMRKGDTVTVIFGDRSHGSPGYRLQTFIEPFCSFRVLVDPVATYTYVEVPDAPIIPIVAGPATTWHAVLPTWRAAGETFGLGIRAEDLWGNPSNRHAGAPLRFKASSPVAGLPEAIEMRREPVLRLNGLSVEQSGMVTIDVLTEDGQLLARSNPLVIGAPQHLRPYWGDLHAQSGETIGTLSAQDYLRFARDVAFLDAVGHQANDFQVTPDFWRQLNDLMRDWNAPGTFVTVPGYEWSGNTALGGDHNVFFMTEDRPIRRSSHALIPDRSDQHLDCFDSRELFAALADAGEDAVVWAHCGGRYADIAYAHDHALERAVEVHSSWGTFEWLVEDAFRLGYRVGIVGNSDGHKGRPGAEPPGASLFGALGGLTCYLMPELSRTALFEAMRARRHYATTGCRLHLSACARLPADTKVWSDDPRVANARSHTATTALMGDIVQSGFEAVDVDFDIAAASPIVAIDLRNGLDVIETIRPSDHLPLGRRVRVEWSGAEYRGRGRQTIWEGGLTVSGATIETAKPINFFNPDRPLRINGESEVGWTSVTTGNFAGMDLMLSSDTGDVRVKTTHAALAFNVSELGQEPVRVECGKLRRELRAYRLPESGTKSDYRFSRRVALKAGSDNPIYVCVTLEDGHQAWSSPIYFIRDAAGGSAP